MLYLLFGKQRYLIEQKINEIIIENKFDELNISKYNLEENDLKQIIDDAIMISLFDDKKLILVENSFIFSTVKKKKEIDTKILENYFDNPNPNTIIIFISDDENINNVKKIVKTIKKVGKVFEFNDELNKITLIKNELKDYKINDKDIQLFIDRVGNDLNIINQELIKLKIYKDNNLNITREDILNLTCKNYELNIFSFIDKIIYKKIDEALVEYYEMLKYNEEPIKIISILADNFRIMYQAKQLNNIGYNIFDIGSELGENPYRIKFILEKSREYTDKRLLQLLDNLAELDFKIKTNKIDKKLGLELFIINQKEVI